MTPTHNPFGAARGLVQSILDAAPVGITVVDLEGRYVLVNGFASSWVGRDTGTVLGHTAAEYLSVRLASAIATAEEKVRETGAVEHFAAWSDPVHGDPSLLDISVFPVLDESGTLIGTGAVYDDVTSHDHAIQALHRAADERRELLDRVVDAQERERAQIAADIHDDSVQAMAAVGLRLTVLRRHIPDDDGAHEHIAALQQTIGTAMNRLRNLLFDLEPPGVDESLAAGLHAAATFILADSGVEWLLVGDERAELPHAERVTAVRIAKEALTNARTHAAADTVTLGLTAVDGGVEVTIADDGVGFAPEAARPSPGHRGVRTMQDRASAAGGWWRMERGRRHGTTVRYWLPSGE